MVVFFQKQKEDLHIQIIKLEKELDEKQALELEIEQLRGSLKVMEHMEDEDEKEVFTKMDGLIKDLRDREEQLADLEALRQTLTVKERRSNDELQDARKELIDVCLLPFLLRFSNLQFLWYSLSAPFKFP